MVAGAVKSIGVTVEEALYGISFANLILFGACLPTHGDEGEENGKEIDAGNPENASAIKDFFS